MIHPASRGRLLGLFAHPDDETFICGGTLAHYAKQGAEVTVVSATKGEMGRRMGNPPFITRESMPEVREEELREACRCLEIAQPLFLGIRDKTVEYADYDALVERLRSILVSIAPDTVLTFHPEWGGHPDHCAIGRAAVEAVAGLPINEQSPPAVYYISYGDPTRQAAISEKLDPADVVRVDVSDSLMEKLRAFRAHRSQTELDEWIWKPDAEAIRRFDPYEYFIVR